MREFELDPGGHTPQHFHPYEHEIYVLEGEGAIVDGDRRAAAAARRRRVRRPRRRPPVPQHRQHGRFSMLCLIPNSATDKTVTVVPECGLEPAAK